MPIRDTPWPDGTPCWVDYGAADLDATKAFSASVLGRLYSGGEPESGGYLTVTVDGRAAAGMGPQQEGVTSLAVALRSTPGLRAWR